jgi:hypothetical protein
MFIHVQVSIYFLFDLAAVDMHVTPLMNFEFISAAGV